MSSKTIFIQKIKGSASIRQKDLVAVEEPLEIRLGHGKGKQRSVSPISVTMRTPGNDEELALGFLFSEGIIKDYKQVASIQLFEQNGQQNTVLVNLHPEIEVDLGKLDRHFYTTSSCGVCGKQSLDLVATEICFLPIPNQPRVEAKTLMQLPQKVRAVQPIFQQTGGIHAAALCNDRGELLLLREDVGRHNAMDKLLGAALRSGQIPLSGDFVLLSGRASFELVQKALMAGIPMLAAVGAPSSLAVELADQEGMTLVGFLKEDRMNVYCDDGRVF